MVESKFIQRPWIEIKGMVNWRSMKDKILSTKKYPKLLHQHYATSTKFYNAKRHFKALKELVSNHIGKDLITIEYDKKKWISKIPATLSENNLQFYDELEFIFYNLRSCIDAFLWEINLIFKLECSKAAHVRDAMNKKCKENEINNLLTNLQNEEWFIYLSQIRNKFTHRLLFEIATAEDLKLYLPTMSLTKKPDLFFYGAEKEYELFNCLNELTKNVMGFLEKGYKILVLDFPKIG